MKYVINFSGGVCSYIAARRIVERHGPRDVVLLFADTLIEDPDLYRFLEESSLDLGVPVTRIADGRTPWQVFHDNRFLGNSRFDPCSSILKRELLDKWRSDNCDPCNTVIVVGLSGEKNERARYLRFKRKMRARGWRTQAPAMIPYISKVDMFALVRSRGIEIPELYEEGFPHNNCGGACVKMGHAHARLLLQKRPALYAEWERQEQALITHIGKPVSILTDRRGDGKKKPLTLTMFRERIERGEIKQCADWGGCGCAIDS